MTPSEAAGLLAIAAAFDQRTIGEMDAQAWAATLRGLDPADCAEAIRQHYAVNTDRLMPAHVRRGANIIRSARLRSVASDEIEPADVDPNDVAAYLAATKRRRAALLAKGEDTEDRRPQSVRSLMPETLRAIAGEAS